MALSTLDVSPGPIQLISVYFIFFAWDVVGFAVIWYFAVETKRLSLEEMDEVFTAKNPKKRSFELARAARERAKQEKEAGRTLH